jgi:hypothetical protein
MWLAKSAKGVYLAASAIIQPFARDVLLGF